MVAELALLKSMVDRLFRVLRLLLRAHIETAKREAEGDLTKIVTAAVMAIFGMGLMVASLFAFEAALAAFLWYLGLTPPLALAVVGAAHALLGLLLIAGAGMTLRSLAMMKQTRAMLTETVSALTDP